MVFSRIPDFKRLVLQWNMHVMQCFITGKVSDSCIYDAIHTNRLDKFAFINPCHNFHHENGPITTQWLPKNNSLKSQDPISSVYQ